MWDEGSLFQDGRELQSCDFYLVSALLQDHVQGISPSTYNISLPDGMKRFLYSLASKLHIS